MCFDPGDGKVVLEAYIMEELANALNERFVTAGLDRVVPKRRTQYTLSVRRLTRCEVPGKCCLESRASHFKAW